MLWVCCLEEVVDGIGIGIGGVVDVGRRRERGLGEAV